MDELLAPLSRTSYAVSAVVTDGSSFVFGIQACQVSGSGGEQKNLGFSGDGEVDLVEGVPRITYQHGDICHGIYERSTVLEFLCDDTAGTGHPVFVNETDDCTYIFHWYSNLACLPRVVDMECSVTDPAGNFYDLTPLKNHYANYKVWTTADFANSTQSTLRVSQPMLTLSVCGICKV